MYFKILVTILASVFYTRLIQLMDVATGATTEINEPSADDISFQLFTRKNPTEPKILKVNDLEALRSSYFNSSLPTKLYAHGLNSNPDSSYKTRNVYLEQEDCNFIAVDWSIPAGGNYSDVGNRFVPLAGSVTGSFLNFLVEQAAAQLETLHLIGHSFGSHVVGLAGAAVSSGKVARITGLDPSKGPFTLENTETRLDKSDAVFVDIIHTNKRFTEPIGHVDFFPNGGLIQPGCTEPDTTCCSHCRVVPLFTESIYPKLGFRSVPCESWQQFLNGTCKENEAILMGEHVPETARGVYYLETSATSPYALG